MKKLMLGMAMMILTAVPVLGQDTYPRWELPLAFSYNNSDFLLARENFGGFQTGFSVNFNKSVGLTIDWAGQAGSNNVGTGQFLIGPRFTKRGEKTTGFGHVLIGNVAKGSSSSPETGLGLAVGGGLDVNTSDRVAIRVFQVDYIPNRFFGQWFNDIRVGVGVVFKWGHR